MVGYVVKKKKIVLKNMFKKNKKNIYCISDLKKYVSKVSFLNRNTKIKKNNIKRLLRVTLI